MHGHKVVTRFLLSLSVLGAAACTDQRGQLVVFLQHGLDVEKDVDDERSLVTKVCFVDQDCPEEPLAKRQLPSYPWTIVIDASEEPTDRFRIDAKLFVKRADPQAPEPDVFVSQRTIEVDIPKDEVYAVDLPLSFLCAADVYEGEHCDPIQPPSTPSAKRSASPDVLSAKRFEVAACLDAAPLKIPKRDGGRCWVDSEEDPSRHVNVALVTDAVGFCGNRGCYIPMNADDPLEAPGGAFHGGEVDLSPIVCDRLERPLDFEPALRIKGVVVGAVTESCPQKVITLPASTARYAAPVTIEVSSILNPVSIAISNGRVFWTEGLFGEGGTGGMVRAISKDGKVIEVVAGDQMAPRELVVEPSGTAVVWANAGTGMNNGEIRRATLADGTWTHAALASGLDRPEGIAMLHGKLVWTELGGKVKYCGMMSCINPIEFETNARPLRIVMDDSRCCWSQQPNGPSSSPPPVVCAECSESGIYPLMTDPETGDLPGDPYAMAVVLDSSSRASAAYFTDPANHIMAGGRLPDGGLDLSRLDVDAAYDSGDSGDSHGIAVDERHVYWTVRGAGSVLRCLRDRCNQSMGARATPIATMQTSPTAIAVSDALVCWINQGTVGVDNGSVRCLEKASIPEEP